MSRQSLAQLKQQRDKINYRIQAVEARERTIQRKQDLQRAVLVGRHVLKKAEQEGQLEQLYAEMNNSLIREIDRQLFEFPPNKENPLKKKSSKAVNTAKAIATNPPQRHRQLC